MFTVESYTIYHSPNSYLGVTLAARALAELPVRLERRPIFVPRARGVKIADLIGGSEPARKSSYHREDCARWAAQHDIEMRFLAAGVFESRAARWRELPFEREELPARAYDAAAGSGKENELDTALFRAAWVDGLDVNEEDVVRAAAATAGLDAAALLARARQDEAGAAVRESLAAFDREDLPGVPTWVVNGQHFWGKDRVDWLTREIERLRR